MTKIRQLAKRKAEMERMLAEGTKLDEYQAYLPDAELDQDLAIHYYLRDTIIRLKKLRIQKGISQADMAEKMGTKQTAVSRFETYSSEPGLKTLLKYIFALQENPEDFLPGTAVGADLRKDYLEEIRLWEHSKTMDRIKHVQISQNQFKCKESVQGFLLSLSTGRG